MPDDAAGKADDAAKTVAETEKLRQETRKLEAETLKAQNDAGVSVDLPQLPSGVLDVSRATTAPVSVLACYRSLHNVAEYIARDIPQGIPEIWLVPLTATSQAREVHDFLTSQMGRLSAGLDSAKRSLREVRPVGDDETPQAQPGLLAFAGVAPLITLGSVTKTATSALAALASLMKTTTTVVTGDLKIPFASLSALVGRFLGKSAATVTVHGLDTSMSQDVLDQAQALEDLRDELAGELEAFRAAQLPGFDVEALAKGARLDALKAVLAVYAKADPTDAVRGAVRETVGDIEDTARAAAESSSDDTRATVLIAAMERAVAVVDQFLQAARTAGAGGQSPLAMAAQYALQRDKPRLYLDISFAGFETQWEEVVARRDRGLHLGAVAVTYILTDDKGNVVASDVAFDHEAGSTRIGAHTVEWARSVTH